MHLLLTQFILQELRKNRCTEIVGSTPTGNLTINRYKGESIVTGVLRKATLLVTVNYILRAPSLAYTRSRSRLRFRAAWLVLALRLRATLRRLRKMFYRLLYNKISIEIVAETTSDSRGKYSSGHSQATTSVCYIVHCH